MADKKRRSGIAIMGKLIGLVKPLIHIMCIAVILGVAGYLCAIGLTITAVQFLLHHSKELFFLLVVMAVMRGVLHYIEQYCNHFIAFKLLAIIRHKVFAALRRLCPAKLEGKDKGNLIAILTTDIELLEVFYAHTISPICIATFITIIMTIYIGHFSVWAGLFALCAYLVVGVVIPLINGRRGADQGMAFREEFGDLNSYVLESLRGLDETIQYHAGEGRQKELDRRSRELGRKQQALSRLEGRQRSITNLVILVASFGMLFLMYGLYNAGQVDFEAMLTCTVAMMGSFGPVVALSSLSNNLSQTLASGERVLSILEENPLVEEIPENETILDDDLAFSEETDVNYDWKGAEDFTGAKVSHVTFAYEEEEILKDYSIDLEPGRIYGIHGASGSGKSTLLKLLMRFWKVDRGSVEVSGTDVNRIPTGRLRDAESYVTQETVLFHDSIANNIAIGRLDASREEIIEAAKKASIHDFIETLPEGYDSKVGELGETLSGGERQRIGIARAFLHDAPFMLLDEPTSNLDSLNEGVILKALKEEARDKTVVLVSHRQSTMGICDTIYEMDAGRIS